MPDTDDWSLSMDEAYDQSKHLRSSSTSKRLRHLRAFERINYKKTCEVKKTGHGVIDEHRIDDGNLRCNVRPITYSLNKKKRWLLPEILEERIRAFDRNGTIDGDPSLDEKLKIEMFENENVRLKSTCFRYANNQTTPQVIYKGGHCFNGTALSRWINFETRNVRPRRRHGSNQPQHDENQPNFGLQNRPGFFPSEVKYEFLYPRPAAVGGKSKLFYQEHALDDDWPGRRRKDTVKTRRRSRRRDCFFDYDEEDNEREEDEEELIFDLSDEFSFGPSNEYPIDYFFSLDGAEEAEPIEIEEPICDRKAQKFFEELGKPARSTEDKKKKQDQTTETLLCSLPCSDPSDFVFQMQNANAQIAQANISPAMFVQRTATSSFSTLYSFSPRSSAIDITVKFTGLPPNILLPSTSNTLVSIVDLISRKLDEFQCESKTPVTKHFNPKEVDALRGSLPLPRALMGNMVLVRPHSTDKPTALRLEHLDEGDNANRPKFSIETPSSAAECSICCDDLSADEVYRLLPCQHCLCRQCLSTLIRTNIANNSSVKCFETNCSTPLNSALLQAFVSFDTFQVYHYNALDRQLFSSGSYRKCPSRICSNLLIADDPSKPSLMCACGQRVCSTCLDEYHFPATCQQYKSYLERLRESGDDLLSVSLLGDRNDCYIAEGKNCPTCGEFVEKNGGCPHMTCKCGYEFCWACLRRWETHNYLTCTTVPESKHELRSSIRNRLHNKAVNRRRDRNLYAYSLLSAAVRRSKHGRNHHDLLLSTYIDMNTMAEFLYVLLQRRKIEANLRAVLSRTARQLEIDASTLKVSLIDDRLNLQHVEMFRMRLAKTLANLIHMKNQHILV